VLAHLVEHEDAVLDHDADAEDGAEEGDDVERGTSVRVVTRNQRTRVQRVSRRLSLGEPELIALEMAGHWLTVAHLCTVIPE